MRLHRLSMTAFGPFAGTETVDFDTLNDAGLFLLSGATGAGKTSILDAVCFALYGTVPGVRGVKALRSQHADELTPPEVVLDFSVRERRFRIRRTPEWTRPKRRGSGVRTENASASLTELTAGEGHLLTSRASEVGLMVSELVGMRAAQFQQVAMLPQGEFQKFLHASSQERHDVLQHLFQTDRFTRIEEWVADHSRELKERAALAEERVRRVHHTLAERAGAPLPTAGLDSGAGATTCTATDPASGTVATLPEDGGLSWAESVVAGALGELESLSARRAETDGWVAERRRSLEELRRRAEVAARRDAARLVLDELDAAGAEVDQARGALAADHRAAACSPVVSLLDEAVTHVAACERGRAEAIRELAGLDLPATATVDDLDEASSALRDRLSQVQALAPRVAALKDLQTASESSREALARALVAQAEAHERQRSLPPDLEAARRRLEQTTRDASRADALRLRVAAAADRTDAARQLATAEARLTRLRDELRDRRDRAADARDRVQELQARRLAGAAAELAGRLRDGEACQVCGSLEHPAPAQGSDVAVSDAEQEAAESRYQAAQKRLVAATEQVAAAEAELAALRVVAAGMTAEQADETHRALVAELDASLAAEEQRAAAELEVSRLTVALEQASTQLTLCEKEVVGLEQRQRADTEAHRRAVEDIEAALPGVPPADLPALGREIELALGVLARARTSVVQHEQAARRAADIAAQARTTMAAHGFTTVDDVRAAVLAVADRARLEALVEDHASRGAAARAVLESPEVVAMGGALAPDLFAAETELLLVEEEAREAARAADLQAERVQALTDLVRRLREAVAEWAPLQGEHARAESMSRLVRGMGSDNQLQMRLSAYVLATRLDQVLDAANERLSHMRDQRYLLQRTARAARKGSQAGLGLEVVDQWTGDVREPSTLSGGETFVVSLSLALGLADVVTQEAGGAEIETLFVDEGFGTLDPDTLDDVMDRLDGLRAGGRTVGVVSHVSELRTRIPAQVHVRKTPQGSTVHAETLVG